MSIADENYIFLYNISNIYYNVPVFVNLICSAIAKRMGKMPDRCIIIGSVPESDSKSALKQIIRSGDYIICADGGYNACLCAGVVPDLYVGDGDSSYMPEHTDKIVLSTEKDLTDMQAAIDTGLARGFKEFVLTCCTGKRFDHHYAAVCMLEYLFTKDATGRMIDNRNVIFFHAGGARNFRRLPEYKYISVVSLDEKLTGVYLIGLKYPLYNAVVPRISTVGVSNEFTEDEAEIRIGTGRALVIYSRD